MSSTTLIRQLPKLRQASSIRSFSVAVPRMAEDAFNKREKAAEDIFVRQQEKAKLDAMKKKIAEKEAELAKDRKEYEEASKKSQ